MLDSHGYTIPKGIAFYDLNAYKKIAARQNSSEYLDDITALCGSLRGLADEIEKSARDADRNRRAGKAPEATAIRGSINKLAGTCKRSEAACEAPLLMHLCRAEGACAEENL